MSDKSPLILPLKEVGPLKPVAAKPVAAKP
jgi:hypothetical protein